MRETKEVVRKVVSYRDTLASKKKLGKLGMFCEKVRHASVRIIDELMENWGVRLYIYNNGFIFH